MFSRLKVAWHATRDPLVADRRYDVAVMLTWFCYGMWGLFTTLSDLTIFQTYQQLEQAYPTIWGATVGGFALVAAVCAGATFFILHENIPARVRCKRAERFALFGLVGLIAVYPITLAFQGDTNGNTRLDIFFLALSFFPGIWYRIVHLKARMGQLAAAMAVVP